MGDALAGAALRCAAVLECIGAALGGRWASIHRGVRLVHGYIALYIVAVAGQPLAGGWQVDDTMH